MKQPVEVQQYPAASPVTFTSSAASFVLFAQLVPQHKSHADANLQSLKNSLWMHMIQVKLPNLLS